MAVKVMKNPLIIHGTRQQRPICASTGTTIIKLLTKFKKELSLNGNCVFSLVSHSKGSPHLYAFTCGSDQNSVLINSKISGARVDGGRRVGSGCDRGADCSRADHEEY